MLFEITFHVFFSLSHIRSSLFRSTDGSKPFNSIYESMHISLGSHALSGLSGNSQDGATSCPLSAGQSKCVDLITSQYDGIMEQLQSIKAKLNGLDHRCNELRLAIDEMQAYSYPFNI